MLNEIFENNKYKNKNKEINKMNNIINLLLLIYYNI